MPTEHRPRDGGRAVLRAVSARVQLRSRALRLSAAPRSALPPADERWRRPVSPGGSRRAAWLIYASAFDWLARMDRLNYEVVDAINSSRDVDLVVCGPGFRGWSRQASAAENLRRKALAAFGVPCPDVLYAFPQQGCEEEPSLGCPAKQSLLPQRTCLRPAACDGKTVYLWEMGDCYRGSKHCALQLGESAAQAACADVLVAPYMRDVLDSASIWADLGWAPGRGGRLFATKLIAVVSHCVASARFAAEPMPPGNRTGAVLFGALAGGIYPLRQRWAELLDRGLLPSGMRFKHPGWSTKGVGAALAEVLEYGVSMPSWVRLRYDRYTSYLQSMAGARLCLIDASYRRLWFRKFSEAMLAGCVVVSDLPLEWAAVRRRRLFVDVDHYAGLSDAELAAVVHRAYTDVEKLSSMQRRARRHALSRLTCEVKAARLVDLAAQFRAGRRGILRSGEL